LGKVRRGEGKLVLKIKVRLVLPEGSILKKKLRRLDWEKGRAFDRTPGIKKTDPEWVKTIIRNKFAKTQKSGKVLLQQERMARETAGRGVFMEFNFRCDSMCSVFCK